MRINFVLIFFYSAWFLIYASLDILFWPGDRRGGWKVFGGNGRLGASVSQSAYLFLLLFNATRRGGSFFFCCCPTAFGLRTDPIVEQWIFWDYLHTQRERKRGRGRHKRTRHTMTRTQLCIAICKYRLHCCWGIGEVREEGAEGVVGGNLGRCGGALF